MEEAMILNKAIFTNKKIRIKFFVSLCGQQQSCGNNFSAYFYLNIILNNFASNN